VIVKNIDLEILVHLHISSPTEKTKWFLECHLSVSFLCIYCVPWCYLNGWLDLIHIHYSRIFLLDDAW
jgi:hypothetical protein